MVIPAVRNLTPEQKRILIDINKSRKAWWKQNSDLSVKRGGQPLMRPIFHDNFHVLPSLGHKYNPSSTLKDKPRAAGVGVSGWNERIAAESESRLLRDGYVDDNFFARTNSKYVRQPGSARKARIDYVREGLKPFREEGSDSNQAFKALVDIGKESYKRNHGGQLTDSVDKLVQTRFSYMDSSISLFSNSARRSFIRGKQVEGVSGRNYIEKIKNYRGTSDMPINSSNPMVSILSTRSYMAEPQDMTRVAGTWDKLSREAPVSGEIGALMVRKNSGWQYGQSIPQPGNQIKHVLPSSNKGEILGAVQMHTHPHSKYPSLDDFVGTKHIQDKLNEQNGDRVMFDNFINRKGSAVRYAQSSIDLGRGSIVRKDLTSILKTRLSPEDYTKLARKQGLTQDVLDRYDVQYARLLRERGLPLREIN